MATTSYIIGLCLYQCRLPYLQQGIDKRIDKNLTDKQHRPLQEYKFLSICTPVIMMEFLLVVIGCGICNDCCGRCSVFDME